MSSTAAINLTKGHGGSHRVELSHTLWFLGHVFNPSTEFANWHQQHKLIGLKPHSTFHHKSSAPQQRFKSTR